MVYLGFLCIPGLAFVFLLRRVYWPIPPMCGRVVLQVLLECASCSGSKGFTDHRQRLVVMCQINGGGAENTICTVVPIAEAELRWSGVATEFIVSRGMIG